METFYFYLLKYCSQVKERLSGCEVCGRNKQEHGIWERRLSHVTNTVIYELDDSLVHERHDCTCKECACFFESFGEKKNLAAICELGLHKVFERGSAGLHFWLCVLKSATCQANDFFIAT